MTARTKILLVIFFIIVVIAGGILQMRSQQKEETGVIPPPQETTGATKTAVMTLTLPATAVKAGQTFNVALDFSNTDAGLAAFDAVISYDPAMLRVDEIRISNVFQSYPRKLIQPDKKRLIVTGVQTDLTQNISSTSGELATLVLTPLKSGTAKLEFVIDGDKYTNMTNKTPANVLGKAEGVEIQIAE